MRILASTENGSGRTAMALLRESALLNTVLLWAENSPFESKDVLRERRYRWNPAARVWWTEIPEEEHVAELEWLAANVYQRRVQDLVDALQRQRGSLEQLRYRFVALELLVEAREAGPRSMKSIEAIYFMNRVWTAFIEDLGSEENALPKELRANLISIGLWLLREGEEVRQGRSENFDGLIEVSEIIRDGLQ